MAACEVKAHRVHAQYGLRTVRDRVLPKQAGADVQASCECPAETREVNGAPKTSKTSLLCFFLVSYAASSRLGQPHEPQPITLPEFTSRARKMRAASVLCGLALASAWRGPQPRVKPLTLRRAAPAAPPAPVAAAGNKVQKRLIALLSFNAGVADVVLCSA